MRYVTTAFRGIRLHSWLTAVALLCWLAPNADAAVSLSHVFGNGMVLQRDLPITVWGWADPTEKVVVHIASIQANAVSDEDGNWQVKLPAMPAGGPFVLTVSGSNTITCSNVMIGEVWIAAGQQGMTRGIGEALHGDQEIKAVNFPMIRILTPRNQSSGLPLSDIAGEWRVCNPDSAWRIPAIPYFFARSLHQKLGVAVGIITAATDGPGIDQFTPAAGFALYPEFSDEVRRIKEADQKYALGYAAALDRLAAFVPQARRDLAIGHQVEPPPEYHHALDTWAPAAIYNGMVAPLTPMTLRGVVWYHGESNAGDGVKYGKRMEAVFRGWRDAWKRPDLPFYYVQLPPFRYDANQPLRLPELWEGEASVLKLPHTGMVVINDLANPDNRLTNKQEVGARLALMACAKTYGMAVVCSGPQYSACSFHDGKATITFTNAQGLTTRDGKDATWFLIAGADHVFVPAHATIIGETVVVSADTIPAPVAVRFAWSQEAQPNLMNSARLPAAPFRSDDWPLR